MWVSMKPFMRLLSGPNFVVRRMGAFALANLMMGIENRQLLLADVGRSYGMLQCSVWSHDEKISCLAKEAISHVSLVFV